MKILTIDIEEWFLSTSNKRNPPSTWGDFENRAERNTKTILEMLASKNTRATFFILGWIAEQYPGLVKQIAKAGHEIGYHTYYHQHLSEFTAKSFREDLKKGVGLLEALTGKKVILFRAPFFAMTEQTKWVYDQLLSLGIKTSSSIKAGSRLGGRVCGNEPIVISHVDEDFMEFPLNNLYFPFHRAVFSGGGYFRLIPLWMLKKLFERENYIMTYFHPRDFDFDLKYSKDLSLMRNFRNLAGAKSGIIKFEWLLEHYNFKTIGKAREEVLSNNIEAVDLEIQNTDDTDLHR